MVIEGKGGGGAAPPPSSIQTPKKTFSEDLSSTFSSPLAWILVLALVVTWSCVFVIMFDLMDYKTISGMDVFFHPLSPLSRPPPVVRKVFKESGRRGGLTKIGSDPMRAVNDAMEESSSAIGALFKFASGLIAPEDDEGPNDSIYAETFTCHSFQSGFLHCELSRRGLKTPTSLSFCVKKL
uniref:Triadin n=1 Tax=Scophthalmus maximus TaxID=52904 RepID=A0A8D2ZXA0_SCOMX